MNNEDLMGINKKKVEAIIFVANKPVAAGRISKILDIPPDAVAECVLKLNEEYLNSDRSFFIEEVAEGYIFATRPEYDDPIRAFYNIVQKYSLTDLNLEVLAIIAYNQPITKIEVDAIRGNVDSTFQVRTLLEKGFIKITGRKKVPGSPFLYGTTKQFLTYFGLKELNDLPKADEIKKEFKIGGEHEADTLPGFE